MPMTTKNDGLIEEKSHKILKRAPAELVLVSMQLFSVMSMCANMYKTVVSDPTIATETDMFNAEKLQKMLGVHLQDRLSQYVSQA